jgi:hypothetical protein
MPEMPSEDAAQGWAWFADDATAGEAFPEELALCRTFARCFAGPDGRAVLEHLRRTVLERRLAPHASDAELRHLEGQRCAVAHIVAMVERGGA